MIKHLVVLLVLFSVSCGSGDDSNQGIGGTLDTTTFRCVVEQPLDSELQFTLYVERVPGNMGCGAFDEDDNPIAYNESTGDMCEIPMTVDGIEGTWEFAYTTRMVAVFVAPYQDTPFNGKTLIMKCE
jgi:hypothetical protein